MISPEQSGDIKKNYCGHKIELFLDNLGNQELDNLRDHKQITIEQQIRTNIDYDSLLLTHREDVEQIDEIVNLISEILVKGDKRKIYIAGDMLDCEYVKERFRELNNKHIRYVLFILKNNKKKINNIKQYLLTVLFNAPATCCSFFQNQTFDK